MYIFTINVWIWSNLKKKMLRKEDCKTEKDIIILFFKMSFL